VNIGNKIIFASALALAAVGSAYAAEEDALVERGTYMSATAPLEQHVVTKRVRAQHAVDTRAYASAGASVGEIFDFGIGSQR
jgi:hypothetical protein